MSTTIEDQVSALKYQYEDRFREAGYPATVEIGADLTLQRVIFNRDQARHILPLVEGFERPALPPHPFVDDPEVVAYNQQLRDTVIQMLTERVSTYVQEDGGVVVNDCLFMFGDIRTCPPGLGASKLHLTRGVRVGFNGRREYSLQARKEHDNVTPAQLEDFIEKILRGCNVKLVEVHLEQSVEKISQRPHYEEG